MVGLNGPMVTRKVVCAAIRCREDADIILLGPRHFDETMRRQIMLLSQCLPSRRSVINYWEEGFIDQFGTFMDRREAYVCAWEAFQVDPDRNVSDRVLFSEGLY